MMAGHATVSSFLRWNASTSALVGQSQHESRRNLLWFNMYPLYSQLNDFECSYIVFHWWWWLPQTLVRVKGGGRRRREGTVWKNLKGGRGESWLRGNCTIQSAPCCTMCKRDWVGIVHEVFENGIIALHRHPGIGYTGGRRNSTLDASF